MDEKLGTWVGSATRTPTWARRLLTRLARLFWSLASVRVVDGTREGDRNAIWRESQKLGLSNGRTPKLHNINKLLINKCDCPIITYNSMKEQM